MSITEEIQKNIIISDKGNDIEDNMLFNHEMTSFDICPNCGVKGTFVERKVSVETEFVGVDYIFYCESCDFGNFEIHQRMFIQVDDDNKLHRVSHSMHVTGSADINDLYV